MNTKSQIKSCLVVSYGPVPTSQYQTVEGGGMRAWGLAKGLKAHSIDVTVGVNNSFPQELKAYEGIQLVNWGQDEQFAQLINSFDAVLISYTMGSDSEFVADRINDSVQLILDAYVPIYVEVSARESQDVDSEYLHYMDDIVRFNKVLRRGDYFLCASEVQKTFYIGVLSTLGVINPRSYREDRLLIAPFGIHDTPAVATENPYLELGIKKSDFVAMWFGGLYPWFHIQELLDAVLELSKDTSFKFVIVGGKNPFNPNPDFAKQYQIALDFANKHNLLNTSVFFVDWVDFDKRINYYKHSDIVVSLNKPGQENGFSWRTRVMDFVWGELAIITNGGDPLSEHLIADNAALRLKDLSAGELVKALQLLQKNPADLKRLRKNITDLKPRYYWQNIMAPIANLITEHQTPFAGELDYKQKLHIDTADSTELQTQGPGKLHKVLKVAGLPRKVVTHARRKGVRRSAALALNISKTQVRKHLSPDRKRRYIFISHPINNTGAPLVLLQMLEEFARKYGGKQILLVAPSIGKAELRRLRRLGIKVDKAVHGLSFRLVRLQLGLRRDDFVLMNTVAIYDSYRDFIMLWLRTGRLKHAYWFIHEDPAQLPLVHKEFLDERNITQTHKLIKQGKLTVLTPSRRTKDEYQAMLSAQDIHPINLHVEVPEKYQIERPVSDYKTVNFLLSGTASDGRKGQLLALAAFQDYIKEYRDKKPGDYRDFKLHLVAIGEDYISQQIKWIAESLLPNNVVLYPPLPKDEALAVTAACNAVICCSLNETFGLYIGEGMLMGHIVLRNNSAGQAEQLKEGKNGFAIDHTDINQFAATIAKVLSKKDHSDKELQAMGQSSQQIIHAYASNTYLEQIERL